MDSYRVLIVLVLTLSAHSVTSLDNGLALTPPMGWLSWERFECNTDCVNEPDNCIGERLIKTIADAMVDKGFLAAGYEYITIDDCWPARERDAQGRLQGDLNRFPNGMKALADYGFNGLPRNTEHLHCITGQCQLHSRGLKFGLYEDVGLHTCQGSPGSQGHIPLDAQTFADWGIDMIKFDGCYSDEPNFQLGYPLMAKSLNETGRHILYSCEWPLYERAIGVKPNYTRVAEYCNTWRVYGDIYDAWQSITSVLNYYGDDEGSFTKEAGPGHFNDGDMITLGNYGLSPSQERLQMGMWAIIASQLFMSVDVRNIPEPSRQLLQNTRVLSINQDPLGIQGRRIMKFGKDGLLQVWVRPVSPHGSYAIAYMNMNNSGYPMLMSVRLADMGLTSPGGYNITEVFDGHALGTWQPSQNFTARVEPPGIALVRATVLPCLSPGEVALI